MAQCAAFLPPSPLLSRRALVLNPLSLSLPPSPQAKLAKLRRELLEPAGSGAGGGGRGDGFDVTKVGDARVGLVGFPSVGKSTLLTKLTGTFSEVAAYEFTTLTCVPGVVSFDVRGRARRLRTDDDFSFRLDRLNTEALAFSCSIFPVSSKVRRITKVAVDR